MEHEEAAAKSRGGACRSTRSGVPAALIGLILAVLGAGAAPAETAGCRPEGARGAATAESCVIAGTDYRLVRARASLLGTVGAAIDLLRDPASCAEWQAMCAEERFFADGAGHRSIRHRRSGEGFTRRVLVSRNSWWRLESGGALADMVGDDRLGAEFEGTRILCLRERWTFTPLTGGRSQVTAAVVSDPQPPSASPVSSPRAPPRRCWRPWTILPPGCGPRPPAPGRRSLRCRRCRHRCPTSAPASQAARTPAGGETTVERPAVPSSFAPFDAAPCRRTASSLHRSFDRKCASAAHCSRGERGKTVTHPTG